MTVMPLIGAPAERVDGPLKVRGRASYAADTALPGLTHAVILTSAVASGSITSIDTAAALAVPGVLAVMTHDNAPKLGSVAFPQAGQARAAAGHELKLLQDERVHWWGQTIGVVVAETLEAANEAATLVEVKYAAKAPQVDLAGASTQAFVPKSDPYGQALETKRGEPEAALSRAAHVIDATYRTATNNHNPIGLFATVAQWEGTRLTLYDATQSVHTVRRVLAAMLDMSPEDIRVLAPFVGGAFGAGLRTWPHVTLAAIAARHVGRSVKLVLTREQMFTSIGQRPETLQRFRIGANGDGELTSLIQDNLSPTSMIDEFVESTTNNTRALYACSNVATRHRLTRLNIVTPTYMRGPGEVTGTFALECAMDELAHAAQIDPMVLRLINHADADPEKKLPWSSKGLRACFERGAETIGWEARNAAPRSTIRDGRLIGLGCASAMYPAIRMPAAASARLSANGFALVQSGTTDIGPGTYTSMAQVAAHALGLPLDRVRFDLGDSNMPDAPLQGGSMTMASVGSAVSSAALALRSKVIGLAVGDPASPLHGQQPDHIDVVDGRMFLRAEPDQGESYAEAMTRNQVLTIEALGEARPGAETEQASMFAFGAQFAQVAVDPLIGTVYVERFVGTYACGRIINARLARSQMLGGIVQGIGMALLEATKADPRSGVLINANLGDYHLPVQADIGQIDVSFLEEHDDTVNPIGVKGVGELGIIGVAAAIANAVFNATGVRVRDLPITLDKLL